MPGQLFIISGPSGGGKSTIIRALKERIGPLGYSISHTSRKPREHEKDGRDYFFVTRKHFLDMIEREAFVEWAEVYHDFYGTSYESIHKQSAAGLDVLLDLDSQGARNIKTHFENCTLIYVLPPSLDILENRLRRRRSDEEGAIRERMGKAAAEVYNCLWYDYVVINDELEKAVQDVKSIIVAERCRAPRQIPRIKTWGGIALA